VFGETKPGFVNLRPVPAIDEIDRKAAPADVFDSERELRQNNGMVKIRLVMISIRLVSAASAAAALQASS
jgi:hypothetical protein